MSNQGTLYRSFIIRCPRNLDLSAQFYLLKTVGVSNYQVHSDAESLLGALERELTFPIQEYPEHTLNLIREGFRGFVKHFGWQ